jgi:hypothetical protein
MLQVRSKSHFAGDVRLTLRGRVDVKGLRAVLAALRSS